MTYGVKQLRKIQLGLESSKGTAVPATAVWRGLGALKDDQQVVIPDENIGYLGEYDRAYIPKLGTSFTLEQIAATFEQLPYPLSAGIGDVVSGAANGGTTNGFKYLYTLATTALPTVKAYTFEFGDNAQAEETEYAFCKELNLSGKGGEAVMMSSSWVGRQRTPTTFTGALTPPTVEEILFSKGKIYADAVGGTIGTTQLTNTWLGFDMKIVTGLQPVWTGDGQLYFTFDKCTNPKATGSFTFEHDATGIGTKADFAALTTKKYRMEFLGSALTGAGGTFANKALRIDFCPKIDSIDPLGEVNGNDIVKVNWTAVYNPTAALKLALTICNTLSALV